MTETRRIARTLTALGVYPNVETLTKELKGAGLKDNEVLEALKRIAASAETERTPR